MRRNRLENLRGRNCVGNIVVDGRIILKPKEIRCTGVDWINVTQDRSEQVSHANKVTILQIS
jgi:hypothetical protein